MFGFETAKYIFEDSLIIDYFSIIIKIILIGGS